MKEATEVQGDAIMAVALLITSSLFIHTRLSVFTIFTISFAKPISLLSLSVETNQCW